MFRKTIAVLCSLSLLFSQGFVVSVTAASDRKAPAIRSATPRNGQTGISTTVKISIKFSERLYKGKYFTRIKLVKTSNKKAVTIKRTISKNYLKISHSTLAYST